MKIVTSLIVLMLLCSACFTIEPMGEKPIIHEFLADPGTIQAGESTMIVWRVSGHDKIVLDGMNFKDTDVTNFPISNSGYQAGITKPAITKVYALRASNRFGSTYATCSIRVIK